MNEKTVNGMKDKLVQIRNTLETASHLQDLMIENYYAEEVYPNIEILTQNRKDSGIIAYAVMDKMIA